MRVGGVRLAGIDNPSNVASKWQAANRIITARARPCKEGA